MAKRKRRLMPCGHGREHLRDGVCHYGDGTTSTRGNFGACGYTTPAKRKELAMSPATKATTRSITVRGERVLRSLRMMRGACMTFADELGALIEELEGSSLPEILEDVTPRGTEGGTQPRTRSHAAAPPPHIPVKETGAQAPSAPPRVPSSVPRPCGVEGCEVLGEHDDHADREGLPIVPGAPVEINAETRLSATGLTATEGAIVGVLRRFPGGLERRRLAIRALASATSGGFAQALADLRAGGVIEDADDGIALTPMWRDARSANIVPPARAGKELAEAWAKKLERKPRGHGQAAVVRFLASVSNVPAHRPAAAVVDRTTLAKALERSPTSGGFAQTLADLRRVGLLEDVPGGLCLPLDLVRSD